MSTEEHLVPAHGHDHSCDKEQVHVHLHVSCCSYPTHIYTHIDCSYPTHANGHSCLGGNLGFIVRVICCTQLTCTRKMRKARNPG